MSRVANKTSNEYADLLPSRFYTDTPKAVFAALAVSYAARVVGGDLSLAESMLRDEWEILHLNGIVPQRVPK